jgi:hypothetical protein
VTTVEPEPLSVFVDGVDELHAAIAQAASSLCMARL